MKILLSYSIAKAFLAGFLPASHSKARSSRPDDENDPLLPFGGVWN